MSEVIGVLGLGYVGLPVALAFADKFPGTVGFDVNLEKINQLQDGIDITGEVDTESLKKSSLKITADVEDLKNCNFFVVAVPTPIDRQKKPDLTPVIAASRTVGKALKKGDIVVYESTVYPGVTEEICGPVLAEVSGLKQGVDFKLGYSPERINPGDKERTIEKIIKVVSGEDGPTLKKVSDVYKKIITAGVHDAPTIKVAESAKVIENTQRDLNIALMNELALIFDRLNIRTVDVLAAAGTKWNFLKFTPGLVGGHCIGVDPFYLTTKAEEVGYNPQVILAGRRINDGMGPYVAQKTVKLLVKQGMRVSDAKVGVLGLTFKEDVPDIRNSRVPDIIGELREYGIEPTIVDPLADSREVEAEYGLKLTSFDQTDKFDAIVLAVGHKAFIEQKDLLLSKLDKKGVLIDIKSLFSPDFVKAPGIYWSL
jgi:UDP-N-acetyl-D-galactosamine dehydrogenase